MNLNYVNVNYMYSVIWRLIANSEIKVSHHIDRSHFFHSAFVSSYTFFSLPDWGLDCLTHSANFK